MMKVITLCFILLLTTFIRGEESINVAYPPFEPFYKRVNDTHSGVCPATVQKMFSAEAHFKLNQSALPLVRIMRDISTGELDMVGCIPCTTQQLKDVAVIVNVEIDTSYSNIPEEYR